MDHLQAVAGSDSQRPSPSLLLLHLHHPWPPPAVQFHAFSASFVPDESRRLSRLTGFRSWELVLPLQPCSSGSNRKLSTTPLGAPELRINLQNCSVESPVRPCGAAFGSDIWFVLHAAKLFGCQCVSFLSHFRLLRV